MIQAQDTTSKLFRATMVAEIFNISRAFTYKLMKQVDIPSAQIRGALNSILD